MDNMTRNDIMQSLIDLRYKGTEVENALAQSQNMSSESNDIGIRFFV